MIESAAMDAAVYKRFATRSEGLTTAEAEARLTERWLLCDLGVQAIRCTIVGKVL